MQLIALLMSVLFAVGLRAEGAAVERRTAANHRKYLDCLNYCDHHHPPDLSKGDGLIRYCKRCCVDNDDDGTKCEHRGACFYEAIQYVAIVGSETARKNTVDYLTRMINSKPGGGRMGITVVTPQGGQELINVMSSDSQNTAKLLAALKKISVHPVNQYYFGKTLASVKTRFLELQKEGWLRRLNVLCLDDPSESGYLGETAADQLSAVPGVPSMTKKDFFDFVYDNWVNWYDYGDVAYSSSGTQLHEAASKTIFNSAASKNAYQTASEFFDYVDAAFPNHAQTSSFNPVWACEVATGDIQVP